MNRKIRFRVNPRASIHRKGISRKRYIARPSQILRSRPSARLRSRRAVQVSRGEPGFFANPGNEILNIDSPIYQERERRPKWNVKVSPLMDANEGGKMLRRRLPHFTKADHLSAARYFLNERKRSLGAWNALIDREHRRVFGREYRPTDYKISGIGRDEYSEKAKDTLRQLAHYASSAGNAAAAHFKAAGKRGLASIANMEKNPRFRSGGVGKTHLATGEAHPKKLYVQIREGRAWVSRAEAPDTPAGFAEAKRYGRLLANRSRKQVRIFRPGSRVKNNPQKRPSLKKNPLPARDPRIAAASRRFARFTGRAPETGKKVPFPANPGVGLAVGPVLMIGYETERDGVRERYLHRFRSNVRPLLAASHDGRSLYLLGGAYRFTERGIVDAR